MISVIDLAFQYSKTARLTFPAFTVEHGDHCLLLGSSGSGKSTLLYLLGGLLRNYEGSIIVDGIRLETLNEQELDRFRGQRVGFVFQKNHLIPSLNVQQNLMLSPFLAGVPPDKKRVSELLEMLNLADKRKSKVSELSQGQAQRVAIARAVVNHPDLILADEPTSALDDEHCADVLQLLIDVAALNGSTLVIATHDQRLKDKIKGRITLADQYSTIRRNGS